MRKARTVIALFMCLAFVITMVAFAPTSTAKKVEFDSKSPGGGIKMPLTSKTVTYKMVSDMADYSKFQIFTEFKKISNVNIKFEGYGSTYSDKVRMLAATNNLPDILANYVFDYTSVDRLGASGRIIAIDKYLNIMPNFRKYLADNPLVKRDLTSPDGHIYSTPFDGYYAPWGLGSEWCYREDVFQTYGITPKFDTVADLEKTLLALKAKTPESYPWFNRWGINHILDGLQCTFNTGAGGVYYDKASNTWKYCYNEKNFLEELKFINKIQNEKLLPPEWATNEDIFWKNFGQTPYIGGAVFYEATTWLSGQKGDPAWKDYDKKGVMMIKPFAPPLNPAIKGSRQQLKQSGAIMTQAYGKIYSTKAKNPEVLMQAIDWLFSQEGQMFAYFGIKGKHYNLNKDGFPIFVGGDGSGSYPDHAKTLQPLGFGAGGFAVRLPDAVRRPPYITEGNYNGQLFNKKYASLGDRPRLGLSDFENDFITTKLASINKFCEENIVKFAVGQKPFSEWNAFTAEVSKMGIVDVLKIYNTAWARQQAVNKKQ